MPCRCNAMQCHVHVCECDLHRTFIGNGERERRKHEVTWSGCERGSRREKERERGERRVRGKLDVTPATESCLSLSLSLSVYALALMIFALVRPSNCNPLITATRNVQRPAASTAHAILFRIKHHLSHYSLVQTTGRVRQTDFMRREKESDRQASRPSMRADRPQVPC